MLMCAWMPSRFGSGVFGGRGGVAEAVAGELGAGVAAWAVGWWHVLVPHALRFFKHFQCLYL